MKRVRILLPLVLLAGLLAGCGKDAPEAVETETIVPVETEAAATGAVHATIHATGTVERRKRVRTRLHWPVLMFRQRPGSENVESVTRDLSSNGFYCLARVQMLEGEELVCSIRIPTHDPHGKHLERTLECRVRVIRVVPQEAGVFGIACRIEDYHLSQLQTESS